MTTNNPNRRKGVAAALGAAVVAATAGTAFTFLVAGAGAYQGSGEAKAAIDATHLPPLLTLAGEPVELRYDIYCIPAGEDSNASPCDAGGTVFVRPGTRGTFRELPLHVDETADEGRYVAVVPREMASATEGFTYYAVLESQVAGMTMMLPTGGGSAPQRSVPLSEPVEIALGAHVFGATRTADARILETGWGDGSTEVGLENGRNLPPIGASSFDVDGRRTVHLLDQVHRRVFRWSADRSGPVAVPVAIDGTIADLAVAPDGTMHVLESARAGRGPVLRSFGAAGERRGMVEIAERTASQVRVGPRGPIVLQQPSGQWMPVALEGKVVSESTQKAGGRPGRALPGGGEVVVLRRDSEIRALVSRANGERRSWRVTSATPVAEVQLAEPLGPHLVLVIRMYSDRNDEFVALVLGQDGLVRMVSMSSADWGETAPLSRFRLVGSSLYQLGSTSAGVFVDRYELEVR